MKKQSIIRWLLSVLAIVFVAFVSGHLHWRLDLTQDKRYTLQPVTKQMLSDLTDTISLDIYLDGDMPIGFKRMQRSLRELLDEFRVITGKHLSYRFIDPQKISPNAKQRNEQLQRLQKLGLSPTSVQQRSTDGAVSQQMIYPGLVMRNGQKHLAINLLHNNPALSADENLNQSEQGFEFALLDGILRLCADTLSKVAFIHGHGEFDEYQTGDIERALLDYFDVYRIAINGDINALNGFSVAIVAGPTQAIPEADKLVLDQFIMRGGRTLWLVSPVSVSADSLSTGATTMAMENGHNLNDMLFRYGVRLNPMLVQDLQCAVIPVNVAPEGQQSKFVPAPWVYYPLLNAPADNPITRNLNLIQAKFVSPLDTVGANPNVRKQILLRTSAYSNVFQVPVFVSLAEVNRQPSQRDYRHAHVPVAALLEGEFTSAFRNRPLGRYNHQRPFEFAESSQPTKMVVVADASIICNELQRRPTGAYVMPLGYDRYTQQTYGNKEFVLNAVKYLVDDDGVMSLRSRDFRLRLLDRKRIADERLRWQLLNMLLPPALLLIGGAVWWVIRRRRYAR